MNKKQRRALKFWLLMHLGLPVALVLIRCIYATCRLRFLEGGAEEFREKLGKQGEGRIVLIHHGVLGCLPALHKIAPLKERPVFMLSSPSKDGQIGMRASRHFGLQSVEGSTASHAQRAAISLLRIVRRGDATAITVDGPRGPRTRLKEGTHRLAASSKVPIFLIAISADRCWSFRSWDRIFIPKPFATMAIGSRLLLPEDPVVADAAHLEAALLDLARSLPGQYPPAEEPLP